MRAILASGEGWRVGRIGEEWDGVTAILVDELQVAVQLEVQSSNGENYRSRAENGSKDGSAW